MPELFDPYSKEYFADPYRIYKQLRDEAPVYHNTERNFWALSRPPMTAMRSTTLSSDSLKACFR